jgi:hypothetical protein
MLGRVGVRSQRQNYFPSQAPARGPLRVSAELSQAELGELVGVPRGRDVFYDLALLRGREFRLGRSVDRPQAEFSRRRNLPTRAQSPPRVYEPL